MTNGKNIIDSELWSEQADLSFIEFLEVTRAFESGIQNEYSGKIPAHIARIASVLERVAQGQLSRVILLTPPKHRISILLTHFLAYLKETNLSAAVDDFMANRKVFDSRRPPILFATWNQTIAELAVGRACQIAPQGEQRIMASTVGDSYTGIGFDAAVVRLPNLAHRKPADSEFHSRVIDWFDNDLFKRLARPDAPIVVSDYRWHERDLVWHLLTNHADQNWHVVYLPAICQEQLPAFLDDVSVEPDWRRPGDPLCPGEYDLRELAAVRQSMSPGRWNAMWQLDPRRWNGE